MSTTHTAPPRPPATAQPGDPHDGMSDRDFLLAVANYMSRCFGLPRDSGVVDRLVTISLIVRQGIVCRTRGALLNPVPQSDAGVLRQLALLLPVDPAVRRRLELISSNFHPGSVSL